MNSCVCCGSDTVKIERSHFQPFIADRVFNAPNAIVQCKSVTCQICGAVFCDHRFTDAEMERLYHGYRDIEYTTLRDKYEPGYFQRNEALKQVHFYLPQVEGFIKPHLQPGRVLDYGGGSGINTPFKDRDCEIYDIDGKQITLHTPYALVVLANVLEHVPWPLETLAGMREFMNPDTVLYIEVPYCPPGFVSQRGWHEHINFFPESAMLAMLKRAGLTVLDSIYQEPVYQLVVRTKGQ
jgi:hypothetical protein